MYVLQYSNIIGISYCRYAHKNFTSHQNVYTVCTDSRARIYGVHTHTNTYGMYCVYVVFDDIKKYSLLFADEQEKGTV